MIDAQLQIMIIETVYFMLVFFPSIYIYDKTRKIYRFSSYDSIRYFSYAFLSLAAAFIFRYATVIYKIYNENNLMGTLEQTSSLFIIIMELFMMLPGFFLFYSIYWKRIKNSGYGKNIYLGIISVFLLGSIISLIDYLNGSLMLMYLSQISLFAIASYVSFRNQHQNSKGIGKLFHLAMLIFLLTWIINFFAQYTIQYFPTIRLYAYALTVISIAIITVVIHRLAKDF